MTPTYPPLPAGLGPVKKERSFDLALTALVLGQDAGARPFSERTELASVSAQEARLRLRTPVAPGGKVRLNLQVPPTLFLERPLELSLSGTILQVLPDHPGKDRVPLVRVQLDRDFQIQARSA